MTSEDAEHVGGDAHSLVVDEFEEGLHAVETAPRSSGHDILNEETTFVVKPDSVEITQGKNPPRRVTLSHQLFEHLVRKYMQESGLDDE